MPECAVDLKVDCGHPAWSTVAAAATGAAGGADVARKSLQVHHYEDSIRFGRVLLRLRGSAIRRGPRLGARALSERPGLHPVLRQARA